MQFWSLVDEDQESDNPKNCIIIINVNHINQVVDLLSAYCATPFSVMMSSKFDNI